MMFTDVQACLVSAFLPLDILDMTSKFVSNNVRIHVK